MEINALDVNGLFALGDKLMADGEPAAAVPVWERAMELNPGGPNARYNRAICLKRMGDLQGALAGLTQFIELAPADADGWEQRGHVRLALGDAGGQADLAHARMLEPQRAAVTSAPVTSAQYAAGAHAAAVPAAGSDSAVTGRNVLYRMGIFVAFLLAIAADLAVMILVAIPLTNTWPVAGGLLIAASTIALLVMAPFALAAKVTFAITLFSWGIETLLALRYGRRLAGLGLVGFAAWIAYLMVIELSTRGLPSSARDFKSAVAMSCIMAFSGCFGLVLMVDDEAGRS